MQSFSAQELFPRGIIEQGTKQPTGAVHESIIVGGLGRPFTRCRSTNVAVFRGVFLSNLRNLSRTAEGP